jgi:CO/xanthine dehydrogenase FAD-binding subunit
MQMNSGPSAGDYARPASLDAVLRHAGAGWTVLAGGTDLYPGQGARLAGRVVDITAVPALGGITAVGGGLRIGAATPWTAIAEAALPPACAALQEAARQVGGRQIQNAGTLGGNLCNASPAADGVPPLLALDARVELAGPDGARHVALDAFLKGPRRTDLGPGEILAAIHVPAGALEGRSAFEKLGARAYLVISIAMVAVRLEIDGDRIRGARVAVGACGPVALRLRQVEAALLGPCTGAAGRVAAEAVADALHPIDDVRASAAYRRRAAHALVCRAVERAL